MALTQMKFDKVWTSATDFPTYEVHEDQVRKDMQYLFDSIKNQFNNFLANEFIAENMSFTPTTGEIEATNVQDAIEAIHNEIKDISQGSVADGAISALKLSQVEGEEAVVTEVIRDGAVTTAKLADGSVTLEKLAPGALGTEAIANESVTQEKLSVRSVGTNQLVPNCVTAEKLANQAVITQRLADLAVTTAKLADASVTSVKLGDMSVITAKLADGSVTTAKIADLNVTTGKLADLAVTTAKIADGAVTHAKTTGIQSQHKTATVTLASGKTSWSISNVAGVTASNSVHCSPAPASFAQWVDNRVRPSAQGNNSLSFVSDTAPTAAITVSVLILD